MNTKWQYLKAKKKFVYTYILYDWNIIHANFARIQIDAIGENLHGSVTLSDFTIIFNLSVKDTVAGSLMAHRITLNEVLPGFVCCDQLHSLPVSSQPSNFLSRLPYEVAYNHTVNVTERE